MRSHLKEKQSDKVSLISLYLTQDLRFLINDTANEYFEGCFFLLNVQDHISLFLKNCRTC